VKMELRSGLVEVPGGLPTFASAGLEARAVVIGRIAADSYAYLADLLALRPDAQVLVLSEADWASKSGVPLYGLPNAFAYRHRGPAWVIRFSALEEDFRKDERVVRHASSDLPIPQIVKVGRVGDGFYAISERLSGDVLEIAAEPASTTAAGRPAGGAAGDRRDA
jgi:hypothetical protein